jgi:hypothetical protein
VFVGLYLVSRLQAARVNRLARLQALFDRCAELNAA